MDSLRSDGCDDSLRYSSFLVDGIVDVVELSTIEKILVKQQTLNEPKTT